MGEWAWVAEQSFYRPDTSDAASERAAIVESGPHVGHAIFDSGSLHRLNGLLGLSMAPRGSMGTTCGLIAPHGVVRCCTPSSVLDRLGSIPANRSGLKTELFRGLNMGK
jgi:hypothetical protein